MLQRVNPLVPKPVVRTDGFTRRKKYSLEPTDSPVGLLCHETGTDGFTRRSNKKERVSRLIKQSLQGWGC
jgi:hypothetical protein